MVGLRYNKNELWMGCLYPENVGWWSVFFLLRRGCVTWGEGAWLPAPARKIGSCKIFDKSHVWLGEVAWLVETLKFGSEPTFGEKKHFFYKTFPININWSQLIEKQRILLLLSCKVFGKKWSQNTVVPMSHAPLFLSVSSNFYMKLICFAK